MNRKKSIFIIILATFLVSLAQVFFKIGSQTVTKQISSLLLNLPLFFGFLFYGFGAILVLMALRGNELTLIYPMITTSYVWVFFISVYFFDEIFSFFKVFGILLIIMGISIINMSKSRKKSPQVMESLQ